MKMRAVKQLDRMTDAARPSTIASKRDDRRQWPFHRRARHPIPGSNRCEIG